MEKRRNARGWLTKDALGAGYFEERAWIDSENTKHLVTLKRAAGYGYVVVHTHDKADGQSRRVQSTYGSLQLTQARQRFTRESTA